MQTGRLRGAPSGWYAMLSTIELNSNRCFTLIYVYTLVSTHPTKRLMARTIVTYLSVVDNARNFYLDPQDPLELILIT